MVLLQSLRNAVMKAPLFSLGMETGCPCVWGGGAALSPNKRAMWGCFHGQVMGGTGASKVKLLRPAHLRDRGTKQERAPWPPVCQCGASAAGSPQPCPDSASRGFPAEYTRPGSLYVYFKPVYKNNLKVGFEHSTSNSINNFHKNVEHF